MVTYTSNIAEIARETRPSVAGRLDAPAAAGGTVGFRMAREMAARIHARALSGQGPDRAWRRNAPATIKRKGKDAPNIDTGQMVDPRHIAGDVAVAAAETTVRYGTGERDEGGVSDRERATFAEEGQSRLLIKRPFFWMTDDDTEALTEIAGDEWDRRADGRGGVSAAVHVVIGGGFAAIGP